MPRPVRIELPCPADSAQRFLLQVDPIARVVASRAVGSGRMVGRPRRAYHLRTFADTGRVRSVKCERSTGRTISRSKEEHPIRAGHCRQWCTAGGRDCYGCLCNARVAGYAIEDESPEEGGRRVAAAVAAGCLSCGCRRMHVGAARRGRRALGGSRTGTSGTARSTGTRA